MVGGENLGQRRTCWIYVNEAQPGRTARSSQGDSERCNRRQLI